jgi:formate-dependent nitrite reductase membrane component NrfD
MTTEIVEIVHKRVNPHIDPSLHIWGWEVPVYLFVGGIVAGVMILLPLLEMLGRKKSGTRAVEFMPFVALGLLGVGMGALFLDLAYKVHVFRFYTTFQPASAMSWGSWILLLVVPALILLGIGGLRDETRSELLKSSRLLRGKLVGRVLSFADAHRPAVLRANIGLGIGVGIYTGLLLGATVARVPWNSAILGPLFLTSGVSTAAAFLLLFRLDEGSRNALVKVDVLAILLELVFLAAMLLAFQTGSAGAKAGAALFLGGAYTAPFWGLVVIMGLIVPLTLNLVEMKKHLPATIMSPALVLLGGFALRAVMVSAGQSVSFGDF